MLAMVTQAEYDAMVRDACERVLAEHEDDRTRALVDAVLGASSWALVTKEIDELNLQFRPPARYSDWPPGKPFRYLLDYPEAASVEEWLLATLAISHPQNSKSEGPGTRTQAATDAGP